MRLPIFSSAILIVFVTVASASSREWTDATGTYRFEAQLVRIDHASVRLRFVEDGTEFALPFEALSDADQEFLRAQGPSDAEQPERPMAQRWNVQTKNVEKLSPKPPTDYASTISRTRRLVDNAVSRIESDVRHFEWVRDRSETYGIRGMIVEFDAAVRRMRAEKDRMDKATSARTFFSAAENVVKYVGLAEKYHVQTEVYLK